MSTDIALYSSAADAAAGAMTVKRKQYDDGDDRPLKVPKFEDAPCTPSAPQTAPMTAPPIAPQTAPQSAPPTAQASPPTPTASPDEKNDAKNSSKARQIRLDQNRKAARESRRRKKIMIEELQRSVIFFSRANGTLKQQNEELTRMLIQAQSHIAALGDEKKEGGQKSVEKVPVPTLIAKPEGDTMMQSQAQAVAAQAVYESQGFSAAAARAAAQAMSGNTSETTAGVPNSITGIPAMQPGATMQAMANFQQAATVAMQAAMRGMQGIPGMNVSVLAATPVLGANPQQAYTDTMTAFAMQQAAAAAATGNPFAMQPKFTAMWPKAATQVQTEVKHEEPKVINVMQEVVNPLKPNTNTQSEPQQRPATDPRNKVCLEQAEV